MQDIRAGVTTSSANDAQNPPPILARRGSQGSRPVFFHSCGPGLPTLRPSRAFCYRVLPVGFVFPRLLRTPSTSSLPFTPCDDPVALRGRRRRHQRDRGSCPHQQRQRRMTAAYPHDQLPRMLHNTTISFWQGEATVAVAGERKGGDSAEYQGGISAQLMANRHQLPFSTPPQSLNPSMSRYTGNQPSAVILDSLICP